MAGPSWLVDKNRIATKIKSASAACDPREIHWKSNPSRACPNCQHIIDNADVTQEWPGLPRGVKFDPSDQEIIWHLLTKVGVGNLQPHPFIDEFVPTVNEDDGICYTHPQKLPGVKQDGSVSHFFHRAIKAYSTGTRKRRKVHDGDFGDVRWHKTGRTKPVVLDGVQKGCKKIMVLYVSPVRGGKAEKTNWVMHQYHLGTEEDEREGEYVLSKVFYQQQQVKQSEKNEQEDFAGVDALTIKVDPLTPKSVTPEPPRTERRSSGCRAEQESFVPAAEAITHRYKMMDGSAKGIYSGNKHCITGHVKDDMGAAFVQPDGQSHFTLENNSQDDITAENNGDLIGVTNDNEAAFMQPDGQTHFMLENDQDHITSENHGDHVEDKNDNEAGEDSKWWDSDSQYLLNSQQLVEGLSLCDEFLQSQSPKRDETKNDEEQKCKPRLSDYRQLGKEDFKKDLEVCQDLTLDPANIDFDTPPDFRLSQLEFASQESYIAWGGSKVADDTEERGGLQY